MVSAQEIIFYLYISVTGILNGDDMLVNIGTYKSIESCEAMGEQLTNNMREDAKAAGIDGFDDVQFSFQCTEKPMQPI
jgi:hypothetical protein|tara:strand:- start:583 stop:816 length:234 start_codon:yes stop_codon:yes gene_type:complete